MADANDKIVELIEHSQPDGKVLINLRLAGLILRICVSSESFAEALAGHFGEFVVGSDFGGEVAQCVIDESASEIAGDCCSRLFTELHEQTAFHRRGPYRFIQRRGLTGGINLETRTAYGVIRSSNTEDAIAFIRFISASLGIQRGYVTFHGAGVIVGDQAALFLAPPGGGKSTVCSLASHRLVLSDENILLAERGEQYIAMGTPFHSTFNTYVDRSFVLSGIYILQKAADDSVTPLSSASGLAEAIRAVLNFGFDESTSRWLFLWMCRLTARTPCYLLRFRKTPAFWKVVENAA